MSQIVPIKAIPTIKRQQEYLILIDWLVKLLSLTGDKSADRLEAMIPMIEECAWSLSVEDIKKAFTKYVKGELNGLEPVSNYLDPILFSKVIKAYKQTLKPKKINETEYKEKHDAVLTIQSFDRFIQDNEVLESDVWIYDYLVYKELISYTPKERKEKFEIAKKKVDTKREGSLEEQAITISKLMFIKDYYLKLHTKGEHIKDFI